MRWSSFTRTSSSVRAASMPRASAADGEGGRDDRIDVLLAAGRVVDAVVADLGRVTRGDLVDAELCTAHRPELAAEAVHEDLGSLARVGGGGGEGAKLRLGELGGDVRGRVGGDVDSLGDQSADCRGGALDDVELARAHVESLRDAVADLATVVAERDDLFLAGDDAGRDRLGRDALCFEEAADRGHVAAQALRGGGRGGRLAADGQRPADEVGADRLPRGTGDAERVADVARVVNRAGDDPGGQDDRDADREQTEEELG